MRSRARTAPDDLTLFAAPPLADQDQRDLIRTALDETLVVEASAGTGKTTELVSRMVQVLASGKAELDRMVAVTFTDMAAGELKLRLRSAIEEARLDPMATSTARDRLAAALPKLEEARIGTIHSFCADLLRERPVEAGVDPRFDVASEDVARPLFERAFGRWFEGQLESPGPAVHRILCRWKREPAFGARGRDEGPRGLLRHAAWQLVIRRDFPAPWRHDPGFDRDPRIDALLEEVEALAEWAHRGDSDDWFQKSLIEIAKLMDEVRRAERVRDRDHDALEARLIRFAREKHWNWKGYAGGGDPAMPREELRRRRDALRAGIDRFVADAGADLAPRLRDELWPIVAMYEEAKERVGCLDFDDLLLRARDLVRDDDAVRRDVQRRFTHYFVDEFQDTDPLQAELLLLLAAGDPAVSDWRRARCVPGKLFIVGDPKQSIYRFRRADVGLYRGVQERLLRDGARSVRLTVSFRSVPEIQELVNASFAPRFGAASGAQPGYVPLHPFREGEPGQPAIVALPVPAPYGDFRKIVDFRIEDSLPDVTAAWIEWLVTKSGWTVTERERPGERVPVEARHVCVLFRRFRSFLEDVTRPYVAALEARGLPHLLVGGSSFHEREEVEAVRNALAAIERPDDELAVFATLRGPLFALSDSSLLAWRERMGGLHPFHAEPREGQDGASERSEFLAEVASCLELLRDLHRGRNRVPVADTIARLLGATRAHAALAIWPTGMQALANVRRLMDMARRAEQQGLVSFRAFVDWLMDESERGEASEAPLLEEGVQGVRLMTVHKAKGLEFPIVLLADMTKKETFEHPLRWTDPDRGLCVQRLADCTPPELLEHAAEEMEREREEALRVLYVATTRARDALVVPVIGDERREGWLAALSPALYPETTRSRQPESRESPGCPAFGDESVPGRPADVRRPFASVMPGRHVPEAGTHRVVWWDPATLTLGVRPSVGLAQTRILASDEEGGRGAAALAEWNGWRSARDEVRARGGAPTRVVRSGTEWARGVETVTGAGDVEVLESPWQGARPRGPRFGTLVHAVLATVDLGEDADISGDASVQARLLGATDEEREAAIQVVRAALGHPILARAAEAARRGACRRETPLLIRQPDGALLECVADLAFMDDDGWTVLDFKTDAAPAPRLDGYRRQVALYARGIEAATGTPARGCLMLI